MLFPLSEVGRSGGIRLSKQAEAGRYWEEEEKKKKSGIGLITAGAGNLRRSRPSISGPRILSSSLLLSRSTGVPACTRKRIFSAALLPLKLIAIWERAEEIKQGVIKTEQHSLSTFPENHGGGRGNYVSSSSRFTAPLDSNKSGFKVLNLGRKRQGKVDWN